MQVLLRVQGAAHPVPGSCKFKLHTGGPASLPLTACVEAAGRMQDAEGREALQTALAPLTSQLQVGFPHNLLAVTCLLCTAG